MKTVFSIALVAYLSYRIYAWELNRRLTASRKHLLGSVDSQLKAQGWSKQQRNELLKNV